MATVISSVGEICRNAKRASRTLAQIDGAVKDAALEAIAAALNARVAEVLEANQRDLQAGESHLSEALLDRLRLDQVRVAAIAKAVMEVAALPDPVGELIEGRLLGNGVRLSKVRVPLGVVAVVYEARPNVTIDAVALALKSGNAVVLKGSSSAVHSNAALSQIAAEAVAEVGLPDGCIALLADGGREEIAELARQKDTVDLIIPRGGDGLKAALEQSATVPVMYAASGNCHIYVDASADLEQAQAIVINAKTQRPGVCNAAETLLIHHRRASEFVPQILAALGQAGVLIRADEGTVDLWQAAIKHGPAGAPADDGAGVTVQAAGEEDWAKEYLELTMAVRIVDSIDEAIEHIGRYGSGHSEAIVTHDTAAARAFQLGVDAACVYVNASTRFTDGGEFGMGAEIGNSTQKLHARGPIGLRELCTSKYLLEGDGHIRR
jgi:glutamate-5-semialdehyde dehydrogenase